RVGTNGSADTGNGEIGIWVSGNATENTIAKNIVSGNTLVGIFVSDGASENIIKENHVGTNTGGTSAIPNDAFGIWIRGATDNDIESNLVSSNPFGIVIGTNFGIESPVASIQNHARSSLGETYTTGNRLLGNVVGLNAGLNAALPGGRIGIVVGENARNNLIGTPTGGYNLISGNTTAIGYGIFLGTLAANPTEDSLPQLNTFQRNLVGLGGNLQTTISNNVGFVLLQAKLNTIGGDTDALANTIVASTQEGISLRDGTRENTFLRNFLGVLPPGFGSRPGQTSPLSPSGGYGNGSHGILLENGAQGNTLGGSTSSTGLVIANNGGNGINLAPTAGSGNRIGTNSIYGNTLPGIDIGGNGSTPNDPTDADVGPNKLQNYPTFTLSLVGGDLI
ncbi:MAG: right-handed parallel beta-helix repeat-containing protein, partial [Pyrinomonadaceae bacterium]